MIVAIEIRRGEDNARLMHFKGIVMFKRISMAAALLAASTAPAFAHLNPAEHGSLAAGLSHPFSGADHMLAMIAVGLWAAQIGGKARWIVPIAFVSMMAVGFLLAMNALPLPFVEPGILASDLDCWSPLPCVCPYRQRPSSLACLPCFTAMPMAANWARQRPCRLPLAS